jgi:hypothetical protein
MRKLLILLLIFLSAPACWSQVTASTCNPADITSAWSSVTSSTTTFTIPAGTCTWTTGNISLTLPSTGNLTIQGSTTISCTGTPGTTGYSCTPTDATIIVDNYASTNPLINVTTQTGCTQTRITGLTFKGGTGSVKQVGALAVGGFCHSFRLDHSDFDYATSSLSNIDVRTTGWVYGVIDHNIFNDTTSGTAEGVNVWMDAYGGSGNIDGHAAWPAATAFGTANFLYIESNVFSNGLYADDCDVSGREVFRFNTVNNAQTQTHPTGSSPNANHGCRAKEEYNNIFNGVSTCNGSSGFNNCLYNLLFFSSGPGMIFNNTAPIVNAGAESGYQWVFSIQSMRTSNATYPQTVNPGGWGYCGTSFNGTGSAIDQNSSTSTGYRCLDQPGAGQTTDLLTGDFVGQGGSGVLNQATGTFAWPVQALEPVYEWGDSLTPVPSNPGGTYTIGTSNGGLVVNRDFYVNNASFTGATGVGSGTLGARPSTCTTGVAYWDTSEGTWNNGAANSGALDECTSTNTWTNAVYTPYTYPDPLTSGGATAVPATPLLLIAGTK